MRAGVLLLVAACSLPAHGATLRPLRSFPDAERAEVERAINAWNERLVPAKLLALDDDGRWTVTRRAPCTGTNGYTDPKDRIVYVTPADQIGGDSSTYATALHELGHVLGLDHTASGVMHANVVSVEFTSDVIAECRRVGSCR